MDKTKSRLTKSLLGLSLVTLVSLATGCQKEKFALSESRMQEQQAPASKMPVTSDSYTQLLSYVLENNIRSLDELKVHLGETAPKQINELRSIPPTHISEEALNVISSIELFDQNFERLSDYEKAYIDILNQSRLSTSSEEYKIIKSSISCAISILSQQSPSGAQLRAWDWNKIGRAISSVAKCVGGTAGSAILGGLTGAGVGTVTLPVIGTVSGSALGAVGGGLTGAATFC